MKTHSSSSGFSLVELALSLGVAMVALVSVVGLLRVAIDSDGDAARDTTLVAMGNHVMNDLRAAPFDTLWLDNPRDARSPSGWSSAPSTEEPSPSHYYFDAEGTPITVDDPDEPLRIDPKDNPKTVFECVVYKTRDELTRNRSNGPYNQLNLRLEFSWPVTPNSNPETRLNRRNTHASIARY